MFGALPYPVISLLLPNTVSPVSGLPSHMMEEVSWGQNEDDRVGLLVFNPLCHCIYKLLPLKIGCKATAVFMIAKNFNEGI